MEKRDIMGGCRPTWCEWRQPMKLFTLIAAGVLALSTTTNAQVVISQYHGGDFRFQPRGYHYHPGHNAGHYSSRYHRYHRNHHRWHHHH